MHGITLYKDTSELIEGNLKIANGSTIIGYPNQLVWYEENGNHMMVLICKTRKIYQFNLGQMEIDGARLA